MGSSHPNDQGRKLKGDPSRAHPTLDLKAHGSEPGALPLVDTLGVEACGRHPHEATAWPHSWSGEGRAGAECPDLT